MERRHPIGVGGDQGAFHRDNLYVLEVDGVVATVDYELP